MVVFEELWDIFKKKKAFLKFTVTDDTSFGKKPYSQDVKHAKQKSLIGLNGGYSGRTKTMLTE